MRIRFRELGEPGKHCMKIDPSEIVRDFITTVWNAGRTSDIPGYIHPKYTVDGEEVGPD